MGQLTAPADTESHDSATVALVTLTETHRFFLSAQRSGLSKPGFSHALRVLETRLKVQLFRREPDETRLMLAGEAALVGARQALVHFERLERAARVQTSAHV